jgi:hypothetical protein
MNTDPAEAAILQTLTARGPGKSITYSEAAKALAGNPPDDSWHKSMHPIRLAATRLARAGQIEILRKGKPVDPANLRGVLRLRLKEQPE